MAKDEEFELELEDDLEEVGIPEDSDEELEFPDDAYKAGPSLDDEDEAEEVDEADQDEEEDEPPVPFIKIKQDAKKTEAKPVETEQKGEKRKIGNPFAALRKAERENKVLLNRIEQILEKLESPAPEQAQEEEEIQIPSYEEDPNAHVAAKQDKILNKLEKAEQKDKEKEQRKKLEDTLNTAHAMMADYRSKIDPSVYDSAMMHLVNVEKENILESNDSVTEEEAEQFIANRVMHEKLQLVSQGKNPAEVFYKRAVRLGFKPQKQDRVEKVAPQKKVVDPREVVERKKAKQEKSGTIAATTGRPAKSKLNANDIAAMSEDDFGRTLDRIARSKGRNSELRMSDLVETIQN